MADVADGWFWADAGPGAPFHRAGERNRPRLWPEALHGRDAPALWRAGPSARKPRIRRRRSVGRRLRHPRLGLAPPAPQGRAEGFSERRALVQRADGPPGHQARHGSEAGLKFFSRAALSLSLLPLWEKVARMQSAPDEGLSPRRQHPPPPPHPSPPPAPPPPPPRRGGG